MSDRLALLIKVNGEMHEALAASSATLLEVLRDQLNFTGTKRGCDHGVCGACTVLIDGNLARSCMRRYRPSSSLATPILLSVAD